MAENGLIVIRSPVSVSQTIDRVVAGAQKRGLLIFARIDHGRGAAEAGMTLRPTELVIFGHARGGTPLMQDNQSAGIDLPLKMLAWQDGDGAVWLGYNDMAWIDKRHGLKDSNVAAAIAAALAKIAEEATR
ncbi:MAG TPA: DUF302 domain-containing protein [Rhizomicrobium sp.]